MDIRNILINNNPELYQFTQTSQYKISREIMELRYIVSFSEKDMAEALNVSFHEYISLEYGDTEISEERYRETLRSVYIIVYNELKETIERMINRKLNKQEESKKIKFAENYNASVDFDTRSEFDPYKIWGEAA